jgi:ribosomal protein L21
MCTILGRPYVEGAKVQARNKFADCTLSIYCTQVIALVEEQAKDAKVIVFKKKRRKNYRRTKGFRREVTLLRVLDIMTGREPTVVESS